jgi:hypothetical protein
MAYDSKTLRMNATDLLNAHQAYVNNQYGEYVKEKNAYDSYLDTKTRSEAIADIESKKQNADHGWLTGALGGAATGAMAGFMAGGPWGALAGGIGGGALGLGAGLSNKSAADSQAAADEAKIRSEPLGQVTTPSQLGNGLMDPQLWSSVTNLAGVAGKVGGSFNKSSPSSPGPSGQGRDTGEAPNLGNYSLSSPASSAPMSEPPKGGFDLQGGGNLTPMTAKNTVTSAGALNPGQDVFNSGNGSSLSPEQMAMLKSLGYGG